jgi:hypothetical protein
VAVPVGSSSSPLRAAGPGPVTLAAKATSGHAPPPVAQPASTPALRSVSERVAERMVQLVAAGPEYAAIAKLSREIIEQIAWEVVPELAETIIRSELDRLIKEKNQ